MSETAPPLRSFIAIPLPPPLQQQIATLQQQLRQQLPGFKTPKPESLHLTLHFLGDQSQELLAKIGRLMLSIGQKKKDFNVTLERLGVFPDEKRPRVLWLKPQPERELNKLYQELATGLNQLGLVTEQRPYRPHLTIGRFQPGSKSTEQLCPFLSHCCGSLKIDRMVLYTSKLTAQGAVHTPLLSAPLATADRGFF